MPYTMEWLQEGKLIVTHLGESITMEEVAQSSSDYIQMIEAGTAPVHIITDASKLKKYTTNMMQGRNDSAYLNHPSLGWHAFYGTPSVFSSLIKVFTAVTQARIAYFRTYEQALAFLREKDDTITIDVS